MVQAILGVALPHLVFAFSIVCLIAALAAVAFHFARCAKRGVCPFSTASLTRPAKSVSAAPLQQSVPFAVNDPNRQAVLGDLQGNVISGHGREHAAHLFIRFSTDAAAARAWLRTTAQKYVVSAAVQQTRSKAFKLLATDGGIFGHISLSAAGYRALGFGADDMPKPNDFDEQSKHPSYSDVFASGMKSRQRYLLDPEMTSWEAGFQSDIHAMVMLAGDSVESVNQAADDVIASLSVVGNVVARENGMALKRQLDPNDPTTLAHVEHFGYVDGRSQPLFLEEQLAAEKKAGGISVWDPSAPLSLVLVRDPLGKSETSCGSFLVFRKLEQNVRAWNRVTGALAAELGIDEELAGAMAVGRFDDGTPVVAQGASGRTDVLNNFDFSGDPQGRRCPFQSHIRKTNPRGEAVGVTDPTLEAERGHRIVRRGIPYGGPLTTSEVPEEQPEGGVGLLFFCYQSDIWEQFEFIQRRWSNNPYFLQPQKSNDKYGDATGLDPVIGQSHPRSPAAAQAAEFWPKGWDGEPTEVKVDVANFVTMKGGEYFFSPSMSFLLGL